MHALLDLRGFHSRAFIHISGGKFHEVNVTDLMPIEAGVFYVMDHRYLDFVGLHQLRQAVRWSRSFGQPPGWNKLRSVVG